MLWRRPPINFFQEQITKVHLKMLSRLAVVLKTRINKYLHTSGVNLAIDVKSMDTI